MYNIFNLQKQPPRGVLRKRCSENIQQIYKRTSMPKCDFNKIRQLYWNRTSAWLFSSKLAAYFRIPFPKNNSGRLLLNLFLCQMWNSHTFSRSDEKKSFFYRNKYRHSRPEVFLVKDVLKMCRKSTEEHPCRSVIPIKLQSFDMGVLL